MCNPDRFDRCRFCALDTLGFPSLRYNNFAAILQSYPTRATRPNLGIFGDDL